MGIKKDSKTTAAEDVNETESGGPSQAQAPEDAEQRISTAEAEVAQASGLAAVNDGGMTSFLQSNTGKGNTGMVLDRTSFPVIVLDKNEFVDGLTKDNMEMEGADLVKGFLFKILANKERISYTIIPPGVKSEDGEYYVMEDDGVTVHTGDKWADVKAIAISQDAEIVRKSYTDYIVLVYAAPKGSKTAKSSCKNPLGLATLSVPPFSKGKVAGAIMQYGAINGKVIKDPDEVIMHAKVGGKIIRNNNTFYPWAFTVEGMTKDLCPE